MLLKLCTHCKIEKSLDNFTKDNKSKDKLSIYCKNCIKEFSKKYYSKNKKFILSRNNRYRLTHKIEFSVWYNKKHIKQKQQKYSEEHKNERQKYLFENKEQIAKKSKEYYLKNKRKIIE